MKWKTLFPAAVGNGVRPTDPIDNTADYQTDGFPQFIANDPVRYDLQNAILLQLLSNDERLKEILNGVIADYVKKTGDIMTGQLVANGGIKGDLTGNATTATNISNTGTVTLAKATEQNQIDITAPAYNSGNPVKLLNFHWYNDTYSLGAIRSDNTAIGGLGMYLNGTQKAYWDASGNYRQTAGSIFSDNFLLFSSGSTGISWGGGDTGNPVTDQKVNLKISSWYGTGFYDGCSGNGYTVGINHRTGDIVSKGSVTGSTFHTPDWFRTTGDTGWYNEKWAGGWHMSDATWIRAYNGKNVYTTGVFQADGGFNGALHGTADYASYLWSTTHKGTYYISNAWDGTYWNLTSNHGAPVRTGYADNSGTASYANNAGAVSGHVFNWSGQDGQPTWLWGGNDANNMYVYNPSNFNVNYANGAGNVNGYSADALKNRIGGRNTPVLTPLLDKSQGSEVNTNTGAGLQGQGAGDLHLVQSYQNFDKILICWANDNLDFFGQTLWEKWELDYAFGNTYRFSLHKAGDNPYWNIWSSVNLGTSTHLLSTPTLWRTQDQNSMIKEIYGLTY